MLRNPLKNRADATLVVYDTIYNIKGKPYTIKTDFIITHPNNNGMKMIADEIFKKIML